MDNDSFSLPKSSYSELSNIILAYSHFNYPTEIGEVSSDSGIEKEVIEGNLGFLGEAKILDRMLINADNVPELDLLSTAGRNLATAIYSNQDDMVSFYWRRIVDSCAFLANLVSSIDIRRGMDRKTLISHIAYSAGVMDRDLAVKGASTIIKILVISNRIKSEDGVFVAQTEGPMSGTLHFWKEKSKAKGFPEYSSVSKTVINEEIEGAIEGANVQIRVDVKVECNFYELDDLGPKLKRLIKTLKNSANDKSSDY